MRRMIAFLNAYTEGMSGADARFIEMAKRVKKYAVTIITSASGRQACDERGIQAQYVVSSKERKVCCLLYTYIVRVLTTVWREFNLQRGDIIYSTSDFLPDIVPAFVYKCRKPVARWVSFLHLIAPHPLYGFEGYYVKKITIPRLKNILFKLSQLAAIYLMKRKADVVCVVNQEIKAYLIKKKMDPAKIVVVRNGVDCRYINSVQALDTPLYDAVFVGRFHVQKGIFDLIHSWATVCGLHADAQLALIGSGTASFAAAVQSLIEKKTITRHIHLLGFRDGKEKYQIMKSSRIFVCPSTYESWGIVIAEAMACGLPVVAYELPVYKAIFHKGIITVPIGNTQLFAQAISELLNNRDLYVIKKDEALHMSHAFDWSLVAENEERMLDALNEEDGLYN